MGSKYLNLNKEEVLKYYSRKEIQRLILEEAQDKEIGVQYEFGFGKRPDVLNTTGDILSLVKDGATSFHCSEELWQDPLMISSELKKNEVNQLRKGWDLVIDIDTPYFEYSKLAADLTIQALKYHEVKTIGCKFSGNHGFHISVPFEAFPPLVGNNETRLMFPEGPRRIAIYLKDMIQNFLRNKLLDMHSIEEIANNVNLPVEEIKVNDELDPFKIVDIDSILISSRHLCRMPYSFNEKSGLISLPIQPNEIMSFNRDDAHPSKIKGDVSFLDRSKVIPGEASKLITQAFDFKPEIEEEEYVKKEITYDELKEAIPEECFPPCIKTILKGLQDGKKRALFILMNFLKGAGWSRDMIEQRIREWNEINPEPLKEVYIRGQLSHISSGKIPPNCDNEEYYKGLGICEPDSLCQKIKNPLAYVKRRYFLMSQNKKKDKKEVKKEESSDNEENVSENIEVKD